MKDRNPMLVRQRVHSGEFVFLPGSLSDSPKRRASPFDIHLDT
jgi:hypothetical protein